MGKQDAAQEARMMDRVGQFWQLGLNETRSHFVNVTRCRILVTESIDKGNDRTLQRYVYFLPDGKRGGTGEDTEYSDLPWEQRRCRARIA